MGWMGMWMARNVANAAGRYSGGPPSVTELSEIDQRQLQDLIELGSCFSQLFLGPCKLFK